MFWHVNYGCIENTISDMKDLSIIPENITGKAVDIEHSITVNANEAKQAYEVARERLLHPACWQQLSGSASATFELISDNIVSQNEVHENDHLRIDVPGPGAAEGDGYDWVKVETVEEDKVPGTDNSIALKLRASPNPNNNKTSTAHFFKEDATSTFIIKLKGNTITASYHGRNEVPNVKNVSIIDKIRNTLVAAGAAIGLSEIQWNALVKGLLEMDKN